MAALTAVETTRMTAELLVAFAECAPCTKQVFLDKSDTYANNLTNLNTIVAAVTAALFNVAAPTIGP
jgi:hypothetical protein